MRAKVMLIPAESVLDLLNGRLWMRGLPDDAAVARVGVDPLTDSVTVAITSETFPEHVPGNTLEALVPECVRPTSVVQQDAAGNVLAVGLTRWIDQQSAEAIAAIAANETLVTAPPVSMPPVSVNVG